MANLLIDVEKKEKVKLNVITQRLDAVSIYYDSQFGMIHMTKCDICLENLTIREVDMVTETFCYAKNYAIFPLFVSRETGMYIYSFEFIFIH